MMIINLQIKLNKNIFYKFIMSTMWFNSKLINNITDDDCLLENPLYKENIDDLMNLHVTKENYKSLISLCDYLLVDNPDDLIDSFLKFINMIIILFMNLKIFIYIIPND